MKNLIKASTISLAALTLLFISAGSAAAAIKCPADESVGHCSWRQMCYDKFYADKGKKSFSKRQAELKECKRRNPFQYRDVKVIVPGTGPTLGQQIPPRISLPNGNPTHKLPGTNTGNPIQDRFRQHRIPTGSMAR